MAKAPMDATTYHSRPSLTEGFQWPKRIKKLTSLGPQAAH
jgi:hypothetical protein